MHQSTTNPPNLEPRCNPITATSTTAVLEVDQWPVSRSTRSRFLEALSQCGNVSQAAQVAGVPRRTVYEWKARDPQLDADIQWTVQHAYADRIREVTVDEGLEGKKGERNTRVLVELMRAHLPEHQRDTPVQAIQINVGLPPGKQEQALSDAQDTILGD